VEALEIAKRRHQRMIRIAITVEVFEAMSALRDQERDQEKANEADEEQFVRAMRRVPGSRVEQLMRMMPHLRPSPKQSMHETNS
jgi:hypothetical protein